MYPVIVSICFTVTSYIIIGIFYLGTSRWPSSYQNKRVLFVTAHPDDEAMFFGPTIRYFKGVASEIFLLCLSNGNYDGLGDIRSIELQKSANKLGFPSGNVKLAQNPTLQDTPLKKWCKSEVASEVARYVKSISADIVITFDKDGVSGHINHKSTAEGVVHALTTNVIPDNVIVYQLNSVNLFRKYSSFLDCFLSSKGTVYNIGSLADIIHIQSAMKAHKSQFTWFRKLYVMFSRYMVVNTLQSVNM